MIFVTVGTSFPFDRLVRAVDEAVEQGAITEEVFAQVGVGGCRPRSFASVETMNKVEFDEYFSRSSAIISHAGMGTISMACERGKPILVMPRLKIHKELVNDHQTIAARRFEQMGHVLAAYDAKQLVDKCAQLSRFTPTPRAAEPQAVAERIAFFLKTLSRKQERVTNSISPKARAG